MSSPGIEPATPCFPACRSNHSARGTVNDMLLKLLHYFFTFGLFIQSSVIGKLVKEKQILSDSTQFQYTSKK